MNDESSGTGIPEEVNGIQVNFCKNPRCPNFGFPACFTCLLAYLHAVL